MENQANTPAQSTIRMSFQATVTAEASPKTFNKANGASYKLFTCRGTSGKIAGLDVLATRTIKNRDGETKETPEEGEVVTLHLTIAVNADGTKKPFFEIERSSIELESVTSDADILSALGMS